MNNKALIKRYEQILLELKKNPTEEIKQNYIMLFKELDLQLNNILKNVLEDCSFTGKNLKEELKRVDIILDNLKYRKDFRNRMVEEHVKFIGYKPIELYNIEELELEPDYIRYKNNLTEGYSIITDLIKSGKRVSELKNQAQRRVRNRNSYLKEADELQEERSKVLEMLKERKDIVDDLYDYSLSAPFNEENAYIQYILIKINPSSTLKIKLGDTPHRRIPKHVEDTTKKEVVEIMPIVTSMGTVKPTNIMTYMEDAVENFKDINIPTNGLIDNTKTVEIDTNKIKDE